MSREESQTALLVAAEALLRAADYPATRGLPHVTVATTLLGQLAGAVQAVVSAEADVTVGGPQGVEGEDHSGRCADASCWCQVGMVPLRPPSHHNAISVASGTGTEGDAPCPTCADLRAQLAELRGDRPGLCTEPECWRAAIVPGGTCYQCGEMATAERVRVVWRDPLFRGGEGG